MKKLFFTLTVAGMFAFIACGPSAEEKAAMDKARQDSIATVEQARQDSINSAEEARATMEKARQDSTEAANKMREDSIAKASEAKGKKAAPAPKKDVKPVGKG